MTPSLFPSVVGLLVNFADEPMVPPYPWRQAFPEPSVRTPVAQAPGSPGNDEARPNLRVAAIGQP